MFLIAIDIVGKGWWGAGFSSFLGTAKAVSWLGKGRLPFSAGNPLSVKTVHRSLPTAFAAQDTSYGSTVRFNLNKRL